jgi:hypothetical protein
MGFGDTVQPARQNHAGDLGNRFMNLRMKQEGCDMGRACRLPEDENLAGVSAMAAYFGCDPRQRQPDILAAGWLSVVWRQAVVHCDRDKTSRGKPSREVAVEHIIHALVAAGEAAAGDKQQHWPDFAFFRAIEIEHLPRMRAVCDIELGFDVGRGRRDEIAIERAGDREDIRIELRAEFGDLGTNGANGLVHRVLVGSVVKVVK